MRIVERHELRIGPCFGQRQLVERQSVIGEEPGRARFPGDCRVEADD